MSELKASGTYIVTVDGEEIIVVITGCAPMLQVTRGFNLSKFIEDGTMVDSAEAIKAISRDPNSFNYRSLDLNIEFSTQKIEQKVGNIEYSHKEYQKWLNACGTIDDSALISKIMLEKKFDYTQSQIIVERLWKDKRNLLQR